MQAGTPSRTAWAAAFHRAAHQVLEEGRIFSDPLALRIVGKNDPEVIAREAEERTSGRGMRTFIASRHRFAEDALAAAVDRGVQQLVVLGAGLDTYAYRNPFGDRLRVIEVDHPDTQAWKRQLLAAAEIPVPVGLTFAAADFERLTLREILSAAGFNSGEPAFFTWLGVVPYISTEAVWSTLSFIASLSRGASLVFDYGEPPDQLTPEMRAVHQDRAMRVAALGEEFKSYFEPEPLHRELTAAGFVEIEDLGPRQIASRYFPSRAASAPERGGHLIRAATEAGGI